MVPTYGMYEHSLWSEEPFANIVNARPDLYERSIVLNGVSRTCSMTSWRVGYADSTEPLITEENTYLRPVSVQPGGVRLSPLARITNALQHGETLIEVD